MKTSSPTPAAAPAATVAAPIDLSACAVMAIDLQNEYRRGGAYPVLGYDEILASAASLQAAAREAHVPVIHVQAWVEQNERAAYPRLELDIDDRFRSAAADTEGALICAEVLPIADDVIVRKRWPSAFKDTALEAELHARRIEHLLVMGVWTDSCVKASVLDAVFGGFHVWLVKDACGSATDTMHRAAVLDMANRLYGGGVLSAAAALGALRGAPYRAWRCSRPVEFAYTLATLDVMYDTL